MDTNQLLSLRGLMIDSARWPESIDHVRRFIDLAASWGINAILFRLTDDSGSAMKFNRHPELITHPDAWTPEQAHDVAVYAQKQGIELIPEIESLGHAKYILNVPAYAHLADSPLNEKDIYSFNGLCMVHPDTLPLIADLYRETAEIFPGRYLHGGCDEVKWGQGELSQLALKTKAEHEILADYLNKLTGLAQAQGRELIVWADQIMHASPAILDLLDQRIILHDWNYEFDSAPTIRLRLDRITAKGIRAIGGPAMGWCRWGPRVGTEQLANMDAYVKAYADAAGSGNAKSIGVIATHWVPGRYFANGVWDHFHYAAKRMTEGCSTSPTDIWNRFAQEHWGVSPDGAWGRFLSELHDVMPAKLGCGPRNQRFWFPPFWHDRESLVGLLRQAWLSRPECTFMETEPDGQPKAKQDWSQARPICRRMLDLVRQWESLGSQIRRNPKDWQALGASLQWCLWQIERAMWTVELGPKPLAENVRQVFSDIAQRDAALCPLMLEHFRDTRDPRQPLQWPKSCNGWEFPHVLFERAGAFAQQIADEPAIFDEIWNESTAQPATSVPVG